ncbi:hypothetical protein N0V90_000240 [Kalmusia sp. IMI 367209]|nr:hypothetical protein N0V90_000240 [Kalmusia sp. IMI 367209]
MANLKTLTAFISGPLDPSSSYFSTYYAPSINTAISLNHSFIIGPVRGTDALALQYLLSQSVPPSQITIYMANFEYANITWRTGFTSLGVNVKCVEEAITTRERDAAMTRDSDYDILRYRTEQEAKELYGSVWWPRVSNTEMNERRRKGISSQAYKLDEDEEEVKDESNGGKDVRDVNKSRLGKLFGRR